jgi:(E)-4-hydroxy-3-methylbut-2-enyl-diphosphate synthase
MYCESLTAYKRRKTITVNVGGLLIGSGHPVRVQSMTTTDTMDTAGSVEQIIRMVDAGCELVRLTAPSIKEAANLANIKAELKKRGITVPLVADIHFTPNAAEVAARIVEKVRINPGNFVDKKKFQTLEYTDAEYAEEIDRIRQKFVPLLNICKEHGTALRIGTNHGSLSDRIMSRYGDTPHGMVESAMEFLRICEAEKFTNIILSMKSSNPKVMVEAYRLLVEVMDTNDMHYPLHLGVTEAGDGDDGRIKSALGIGSLMEDGIGDTIRVSLTEDPEFEIPVAKKLIQRYESRSGHAAIPFPVECPAWNPFDFKRRITQPVLNIGGSHVPVVIADLSAQENITVNDLAPFGHLFDATTDKWTMKDAGCDLVYRGQYQTGFMLPMGVKGIYDAATWSALTDKVNNFPLFNAREFLTATSFSATANFVRPYTTELTGEFLAHLSGFPSAVLMLSTENTHAVADLRNAFFRLDESGVRNPVVLARSYDTSEEELFMLYASTDTGSLLTDGFGDGIMLSAPGIPRSRINDISFGILQAARARVTKTEYISCPSCGRTLFDLQETTAMIRRYTGHLKGVKIAIMGCIVNGPGEMADADYGYVGSGPGKITLYRGREIVKRGVNKETAVSELVALIREDGNWTDATG